MSSLYSLQHDWLRLLSKSQLIVAEGLHPDSPSESRRHPSCIPELRLTLPDLIESRYLLLLSNTVVFCIFALAFIYVLR